MKLKTKIIIASSVGLAVALGVSVQAQQNAMTFFVTSVGLGKGADLGGLSGADAHCQKLAEAAGSKGKTWRAYLSTTGDKSVNARDRIGKGPWTNAKGAVIAKNLDNLHSEENNLTKQTALTETGEVVPGRGDKPANQHDALTGSTMEGRAAAGGGDSTCSNWTSSAEEGAATVGHIDRQGLKDDVVNRSWNSAHPSRGCSQPKLVSSGGAGRFYCFATN